MQATNSESNYLFKTSCEDCGSSDACAVYDDGHTHCFSCSKTHRGEQTPPAKAVAKASGFEAPGFFESLPKRGISLESVRKMNYRVDPTYEKNGAHFAVYSDPKTGEEVAAKVRLPGKKFKWIGDPSRAGLYGQHLWSPGRKLIITEGEIDALSVNEIQDGKWPVVSLANGAAGGKKNCAAQLQWLMEFDEIVLMLDTDEPGREAAMEIASLFPPGKVKIATLPLKDANEVLLSKTPGDILTAMWQARPYQPEGIVQSADLWEEVSTIDEQSSYPYPFPCLNAFLYGMRPSEITTVVSGTGMGKSHFVKEIMYSLLEGGHTVGGIFLEESVKRTVLGFMGLQASKNFVLPDIRAKATDEELRSAFDATAGTGRLWLFDHFGSTDPEKLYNQIRFMVKSCGVTALALDHISILVSGISQAEATSEVRLLDNVMTELRQLAQELDIIFILVSHLKRPDKVGLENGAQTSLSLLRGSTSLAGLSDQVIGLERDQQAEENANLTTVRVLKNRFSGVTGVAGYLRYDTETSRMMPAELTKEDTDNVCPF